MTTTGMFRAVADHALINRMGFNNNGALLMAERLASWRQWGRWPDHPVKVVNGATVYLGDIAQVRDGYAVHQSSVVEPTGYDDHLGDGQHHRRLRRARF